MEVFVRLLGRPINVTVWVQFTTDQYVKQVRNTAENKCYQWQISEICLHIENIFIRRGNERNHKCP